MRTVIVVLLAALVIGVAPAGASFHLMKVNEVQLSRGGDPAAQFIELKDPSDEPFPSSSGPYKVVVYDAGGSKVGAHEIGSALEDPTDASRPFLIATTQQTAASGVPADQTLSVTLPAGAGQVCFTNGASEAKVSCVAYGCVTTVVGGATRGPVPPDGQSLQRQGDATYAVAAPTPGAANAAGTTGEACPSGAPTPTPTPTPTPGPTPGPAEPTPTPTAATPPAPTPKVSILKLAKRISRLVLRGAGLPIRLATKDAKRVVLRLRAGTRVLVSRTVTPVSGRVELRLRPADSMKNRRAIIAARTIRLEIVASNASKTSRRTRAVRLGR